MARAPRDFDDLAALEENLDEAMEETDRDMDERFPGWRKALEEKGPKRRKGDIKTSDCTTETQCNDR